MALFHLGKDTDLDVIIPSGHNAGELVEFVHTVRLDAQSLHPAKTHGRTSGILLGIAKYTSPFGDEGAASFEMFSDGSDGDLIVPTGAISYTDDVREALGVTASTGQFALTLASADVFTSSMESDEVLIIQMEGASAGQYEFGTIASVENEVLTLTRALSNTYSIGSYSKAQVLRVPHYRNVTVQDTGTLAAHAWDGSTGGIVVVACTGKLHIQTGGSINMNEKGYEGGRTGYPPGYCGEGTEGPSRQKGTSWNDPITTSNNGNGGGGGDHGNASNQLDSGKFQL
jgi:hypothetical protein